MGITAKLIEKLIEKYEREESLSENKEALMEKLDLFLLVDRITGAEYKTLKERVEA